MSFILSTGVIVPPLTAGGVAYGNGAQAFINAQGTVGQVLTSAGAGIPTWTTPSSGGVTWSVKTTTYTAASGDYLLCDTTSGAFTVTLPASPSTGNAIYFQDAAGTWSTNNLTIAPGSNNIMGQAGNLIANQSSVGFGLIYNGSEWRIF